MPPRRALLPISLLSVAVLALVGCGANAAPAIPRLSELPLVPGAHIVRQVKTCDPGLEGYCALQLVVQAAGYHTSDDLLLSERAHLHAHGWSGAKGDASPESAADSPGHRLHVTYATAAGELDGIDQGWITRDREIALALSRAIFAGRPTIALMLELGAS